MHYLLMTGKMGSEGLILCRVTPDDSTLTNTIRKYDVNIRGIRTPGAISFSNKTVTDEPL